MPVLYLPDGDQMIVVASNWGRARHPSWSDNLLADPRAVVHIGRDARSVVARLATDEECSRLWPKLLDLWPAWATYQAWTPRTFRVFVIRPS